MVEIPGRTAAAAASTLQLSSSNGCQSSSIVATRELRIWSTTQLCFLGADVICENSMEVYWTWERVCLSEGRQNPLGGTARLRSRGAGARARAPGRGQQAPDLADYSASSIFTKSAFLNASLLERVWNSMRVPCVLLYLHVILPALAYYGVPRH